MAPVPGLVYFRAYPPESTRTKWYTQQAFLCSGPFFLSCWTTAVAPLLSRTNTHDNYRCQYDVTSFFLGWKQSISRGTGMVQC